MPLRELKPGTGPRGDEQARVEFVMASLLHLVPLVTYSTSVVAVHGLNPVNRQSPEDHAWNTWRKPGTSDGNLWLRDKLPEVAPNARVFLYVYNSNVVFGASKERLVHQADDLLETLHLKRTEHPRRPIIFVGHSLGGILIKQALVNAHNNRRFTAIRESTFGLAFFGTPQDGGNDMLVKLSKTAMAIVRGLFRDPPNDIMEALSRGSLFADMLQANWRDQLTLYKIVSFYEKEDEHHAGVGVRIVPRASAVIGLPGDMENQVGLDAGHSGICRFDPSIQTDMDNYEKVQGNFRELYEGALNKQGNDAQQPHLSSQPRSQVQHYYDVPNRRIRSFVGRKDILGRIDKAFSTGQGPRIAVLQGMGGQGKSQVALEYCHRKRNNPYSAIFWVDATTENTATGSFQSISERLKTSTDHLPDSSARVAFVLRALTARSTSWLIVFDNYDDPTSFSNIQDFFPGGDLGAILVTGRHTDASALVIESNTNFIELPGLEKDAALDLLLRQSQAEEYNSEDAEKIVERLGYHPLALTQAGAYIRKRKIALCDFLNNYKHQRKTILESTPLLSQYRRKLGDAEVETALNAFTTLELSIQQLQSETTKEGVETRLLTLLAFFNDKNISEEFFAEYKSAGDESPTETTQILEWLQHFTDDEGQWDSRLFRDVLIRLKDISLLQTFAQEPDGFYHSSLHPLVKDWIQLRLGESVYWENIVAAGILVSEMIARHWRYQQCDLPLIAKQTILVHVMAQEENYETHSKLRSPVPFSQRSLEEYLTAQHHFAHFLLSMGLYEGAGKITQRVKAEREILHGPEHPATLRSLTNLAMIDGAQGKLTEAEKLQVQVMDTSLRVLTAEHPDTLTSMINLAATYGKQGRWTEAEKLQVQVVNMTLRVLGPEHPDTLCNMSNLALTYGEQGRWVEAEKLQVKVMNMKLRVLGAEHPHTLTSMGNLATTYEKQGQWVEAEKLELQVVEMRLSVQGAEHPDTQISMGKVATLYGTQGRWVEAEKLVVKGLKMRLSVQSAEHPDTLTTMLNFAHISKFWSRDDEAIELMEDVVKLSTEILGAGHPRTLEAAEWLSTWTGL